MAIEHPQAADDGLEFVVARQLQVLPPALSHLAQAAPVGRAVEESFDEQGLVMTRDQFGQRIAVFDAIGRKKRKMC